MELELERTQLNGCRAVLNTTVCHEETLEMIVPDACPDILRICDTEGTALLKSKEAQEGRAAVTGTARAAVLYLPDGAEGMRCIEVNIPFSCGAESALVTGSCSVVAQPRVRSAETRILNPRKVLVKVDLAIDIQVYAPITDSLCTGVSDPESVSAEELTESCRVYLATCIQEKPFTFEDELSLSGGKPEAEELLKSRVFLHCSESKVIGSKLIFKGEAVLRLLYRGVEGVLCTADYTLPFSQIMEVSSVGEDCSCRVQVALNEISCKLDGDRERRSISVALSMLAQAEVWEEHSVQQLKDVYSTAYDLTAEKQSCTMSQLLDRGVKNQTVREILESGMPAKNICDAYVCLGGVNQRREGEHLNLSTEASITILYITEDDTLAAVTRTVTVPCQLDLPEQALCTCHCLCDGEVYATPASGGIEVRFIVDFLYQVCAECKLTGVSAIRLDENAPRDTTTRPSVILRMVSGGERLWDIAKAYGTTIQDILRANDLSEDDLPAGQLLLIPRKR